MAEPPLTEIDLRDTCRLIPSRYPTAGILEHVVYPSDLLLMFELDMWTNDRISAELGILLRIPQAEWVTGPMSTVVMAAFCHPRPEGSRFNGPDRGAWYAAFTLETAHGEATFHRSQEFAEIGVTEATAQVRLLLSDFQCTFHDVRSRVSNHAAYHDPTSYAAAQSLAQQLLDAGSNGILYRSVRSEGGECVACFRPKLITYVRSGPQFEYRWTGDPQPSIHQLR